MITWLSPADPPDSFPPLESALRDPPGLLAAGGDLSIARLLAAYARGIFPWYSPGQPVLWWSPDPREVLFPQQFHRSRSLTRSMRTRGFTLPRHSNAWTSRSWPPVSLPLASRRRPLNVMCQAPAH